MIFFSKNDHFYSDALFKCFKRWPLNLKMTLSIVTHLLNISKGEPWTLWVYLLDNFNSGITFWQFSQNRSFTPFCQQMTFEHQWSSHYKENDRLPERRGTYLSEFLIFTRTAKAHPLTKHWSMRSIIQVQLKSEIITHTKVEMPTFEGSFHPSFVQSITPTSIDGSHSSSPTSNGLSFPPFQR